MLWGFSYGKQGGHDPLPENNFLYRVTTKERQKGRIVKVKTEIPKS